MKQQREYENFCQGRDVSNKISKKRAEEWEDLNFTLSVAKQNEETSSDDGMSKSSQLKVQKSFEERIDELHDFCIFN